MLKFTFAVMLCAFSFTALAQRERKAPEPVTAADLEGVVGLPLTADEIVNLKTEGTTEKKGIQFTYGFHIIPFSPPRPTPKEMEKFKKKYGKKNLAPFKLYTELTEKDPEKGKTVKSVQGDTVLFLIGAEDKKVVLKKEVKNALLCPS